MENQYKLFIVSHLFPSNNSINYLNYDSSAETQ